MFNKPEPLLSQLKPSATFPLHDTSCSVSLLGVTSQVHAAKEVGSHFVLSCRDSLSSSCTRRAGAPHQAQALCANLDLAVLVLSTEPNFSEAKQLAHIPSLKYFHVSCQGMVDRVLVSVHAQGLDVLIVLNKALYLENAGIRTRLRADWSRPTCSEMLREKRQLCLADSASCTGCGLLQGRKAPQHL